MLLLAISYLLASSLMPPEIQLWVKHRWLKHWDYGQSISSSSALIYHLLSIYCTYINILFISPEEERIKRKNPSLLWAAACTNERDFISITKSLTKQRYCYVGNILQSCPNHPRYCSRLHHGVHMLTMRPSLMSKAMQKESKMVADDWVSSQVKYWVNHKCLCHAQES